MTRKLLAVLVWRLRSLALNAGRRAHLTGPSPVGGDQHGALVRLPSGRGGTRIYTPHPTEAWSPPWLQAKLLHRHIERNKWHR